MGLVAELKCAEEQSSKLVYRHVTSPSVAQGHINRKILEILEATDIKPSRRRKKNDWVAHNFVSIREKGSFSVTSCGRITL